VAGLQPANYSVTVELQGFSTVTRSSVTVNIGAAIDVNATMRVASMAETVNVTTQAPLIEATKAQISNVISQDQLDSLPSRSRQYLDFALLLPATVDSVSINQQGAGFSLGGSRSSEAALLVDGFYNMDEGFALPKQRYSQDAMQEFQVVSFGGEAQYGRAIGGLVNGITKSGGNSLRGSGYGFFKDKAINANDPASELRGIEKPDYSRQQWGGTLGGPIKRDKSFFFGAYERVKEDAAYDNTISAANGAALGLPPEDIGNVPRQYRLNFSMAKWDHNLSNTSHIQTSFAVSRWTEFNISSPQAFGTRSRQFDLRATDWSYLFKWTKVAGGGNALHEVKLSYFPRFYGVDGVNEGGPPLVANGQINPAGVFQSNATPPAVNISSVANFGSITLNNHIDTHPVQAIYSSTIYSGKHSVKFGADYMNAFYDYTLYSSLRGTYTFSSLANFQRGAYSQYTQSFGDPHNPRRHQYISGFVQDSWRTSDRLTMNYGIRYDLEVHPRSLTGERFGWDGREIGPRFALSYDLTGHADTFLKFSSGLFYDRIFQNITTFYTNILGYQTLTAATWTPTTAGAPVYPAVVATRPSTLPAGVVNTNILPDEFHTPASGQLIATFERALVPNLVFTANAIYTRHWNVDHQWDTNLVWDATRSVWVRPNAAYRQILQYRFDGWSKYVGGIFEVKRRGTRAGVNGSITVASARDVGNNYNSTPNDQRLPLDSEYGPQADTPKLRGVVSGWYNIATNVQISGAFQARSGMAVNPVAGGIDLVGAGNLGSRTPTFERNAFRAPGFNQVDLRFTYKVPSTHGNIALYAEGFNLFNRVNVQSVNNNYGPTAGQPLSAWLLPTAYYPPRQMQFGVHLGF
jgi:hypothetical protein